MSSRVEEEREAARLAAVKAEQRRAEERRRLEGQAKDKAFSGLVGQQRQQEQARQARANANAQGQAQKQATTVAHDAIASLLEQAEAVVTSKTKQELDQANVRRGFARQLANTGAEAGQRERQQGALLGQARHAESSEGKRLTQGGREGDAAAASAQGRGRRADLSLARERVEERRAAQSQASKSAAPAFTADPSDIRADADGRKGGQQGGSKQGEPGGQGAGGSFRLNPALLAPPPIAKQRPISGSDRLREVANQLAQKIVERVRIGTNERGRVEFQIDLKGEVLNGLTVKVSSHHGRIKAVFTGTDRAVLRAIEEQSEALKGALSARGLSLEELKVESRA